MRRPWSATQEVPVSNGEPGTSSNSSSDLSDKDRWLQDALGVKMATYASPTVDASAKVAPVGGVANLTERRESQGKQPPPQAKAGAGTAGVTPHRTRITSVTVAGSK